MNINFTLIAQAIAFAILIWFTVKYVWPPLLNAIETRQKEIADGLGDQLDTKVKIVLGRKKGQLMIDFATVADLNRILDQIGYKKKN